MKLGRPSRRRAIALALAAAAAPCSSTAVGAAQQYPLPWAEPRFEWPNSGAVARFYVARHNAPIWFRTGLQNPAATQLLKILHRAPLDGFESGPLVAVHLQRAIAQAQTGNPHAVARAEQMLSAAWVNYVQALRARPPGVVYGTERLLPNTAVERILHEAATVASLEAHLVNTSNVNPIYAQLREAAAQQAQLTGGVPEPRLAANLARARILPPSGRFVMVEAATQRLYMIDDWHVRGSMKVVVGKPEHATPLIASVIDYATFNPYWNAPYDLIRDKVAPGVIREGRKYLEDRGYDVMANWSDDSPIVSPATVNWRAVAAGQQRVRLRKRPHGANPMGAIKIPFPNDLGIYLHDTIEPELFKKQQRALSLGCIRLEDAPRLTQWLLRRAPAAPSNAPELHVRLPEGVPIYITYLTAQVNQGQVSFLPDVYGMDQIALAQLQR